MVLPKPYTLRSILQGEGATSSAGRTPIFGLGEVPILLSGEASAASLALSFEDPLLKGEGEALTLIKTSGDGAGLGGNP
jgi:hypothetical protein